MLFVQSLRDSHKVHMKLDFLMVVMKSVNMAKNLKMYICIFSAHPKLHFLHQQAMHMLIYNPGSTDALLATCHKLVIVQFLEAT